MIIREYGNDDDFAPLPELVADEQGQYEIIDSRDLPGMPSNGMTDKAERVMWVPLDASGRSVSLHELAHVVWSPTIIDVRRLQVPMTFLRAVEDARVNLGLRRVGVPVEFDARTCGEIVDIARQDLAHGSIVIFTLRAVASFGTNAAGLVCGLVSGDEETIFATVRELITEAGRRLERARWDNEDVVASFAQGVEVARWLAAEFKKRGFSLPKDPGVKLIGCCAGVGGAGGAHRRGVGAHSRGEIADGVRPGRMRVRMPALHQRRENASGVKARRKRATAEGVDLRYVHRFVTDQRIFARPARQRVTGGGTLLIDVSGSMSLSPADIERMVVGAPAGTLVAIYSGSGDRGELRIVARGDYRAATSDLVGFGTNNVVDLPALQWLAKQPGPRVWLSDGHVTGVGDVTTRAITQRCREICAQGRIVRVATAAAAAEALDRRATVRQDPRAA